MKQFNIYSWFRPLQNLFLVVRGNARIIVITEGIANIAFQWYFTFLPLYFVALGLDELTIGWLASAFLFSQFIGTLMGGMFADRFGRKKVIVIGDIICWGIPLTLYAVAQNPWYLIVGRLINGFINVVIPSFECLFVEDVEVDHRPAVFALLQFLLAAGSLMAPLAGLFVSQLGMVLAGRVIMGATAMMAVVIAMVRLLTLVETKMGQERISSAIQQTSKDILLEYFQAIKHILEEKQVRNFLAVRILVSFSSIVWATYAMIFLTSRQGAGLPESAISLVPTISALITLGATIISAERMVGKHLRNNLMIGQLILLCGSIIFLFSPVSPYLLAGIWAVLNAASLVLFQPAVMSHWANIVFDKQRAIIFSTSTAIITICSLPIGPLAGYLYTVGPRLPFVLSILIQVAVLWLLFVTVREKKEPLPYVILET